MAKAEEGGGVRGVRERVDEARRALDDTIHKASEVAQDLADEAVSRGRKVARVAVREVKEHPIASLAIGAAVGVLITALIVRATRRDD